MKDKQEHREGCGCGDYWGHHHVAHVILKILLAIFVFWCGVQFGEVKALVQSDYRAYGTPSTWGRGDMMYRAAPMMLTTPPASSTQAQ